MDEEGKEQAVHNQPVAVFGAKTVGSPLICHVRARKKEACLMLILVDIFCFSDLIPLRRSLRKDAASQLECVQHAYGEGPLASP